MDGLYFNLYGLLQNVSIYYLLLVMINACSTFTSLDISESNELQLIDLEKIFRYLYGSNWKQFRAANKMHETFVYIMSHVGGVNFENFCAIVKKNATFMFPIFEIQDTLRKKVFALYVDIFCVIAWQIFGDSYWRKHSKDPVGDLCIWKNVNRLIEHMIA